MVGSHSGVVDGGCASQWGGGRWLCLTVGWWTVVGSHSGVVDGGWVSQRDGGCVSQRNGRHISQWGGVGTILPMKNINKLYHLVFCLKCPCI